MNRKPAKQTRPRGRRIQIGRIRYVRDRVLFKSLFVLFGILSYCTVRTALTTNSKWFLSVPYLSYIPISVYPDDADEQKSQRDTLKNELELHLNNSTFSVYKLYRAKLTNGKSEKYEVGKFKVSIVLFLSYISPHLNNNELNIFLSFFRFLILRLFCCIVWYCKYIVGKTPYHWEGSKSGSPS